MSIKRSAVGNVDSLLLPRAPGLGRELRAMPSKQPICGCPSASHGSEPTFCQETGGLVAASLTACPRRCPRDSPALESTRCQASGPGYQSTAQAEIRCRLPSLARFPQRPRPQGRRADIACATGARHGCKRCWRTSCKTLSCARPGMVLLPS